MASAFPHLLLLTTLAAICLFSDVPSAALGGRPKDALVGGWSKADPKDPEVLENGKFAIDEHNKEAGTKLEFKTVVEAQKQVVAGTNYKIVIKALDGTASNLYEAIVWVKPWLKFKKLTSFRKLP
uniref:Cysteine proteinase inhibitor CPI-3 n=1 Tax=Coffea canephora TaxID=49390 RepID=G4Y627_COFCA|nr:cysteine proteinase inhibitor CPI-3 [Coffea canephora]